MGTNNETTIARTGTPAAAGFPEALAQALFGLGACYRRDCEAVRHNLHADKDAVAAYLGTYFPRTVVEFRTIGRELLSNPVTHRAFESKDELRVLDVGSGTGGAWIGFALALADAGLHRAIKTRAIDGNAHALSSQHELLPVLVKELNTSIKLTTVTLRLDPRPERNRCDLEATAGEELFDLIVVSKHLSEHYHAAGPRAIGVVAETLRTLSARLAPNGLLVVLDVTHRVSGLGEFFPVILSLETQHYLDDRTARLRPLLPIPCAATMPAGCAQAPRCFTQRAVRVVYTMGAQPVDDTSKVCYRVFAAAAFADSFLKACDTDHAFAVNAAKPALACRSGIISLLPNALSGYVPISRQGASA